MRTSSDKLAEAADRGGEHADTDKDLELLLHGHPDGSDDEGPGGPVLGRQGADLQELVLRIRLQSGPIVGRARDKSARPESSV